MIWTIIGIFILGSLWSLYTQGRQLNKEERRKEREKKRKIDNFRKNVEEDEDFLKKQWEKRVAELHIDLSRAKRVLYYTYYYKDENNTHAMQYHYIWDEDGAIADFQDYEEVTTHWIQSPLEWKIVYFYVDKIEGIYKRNDATRLQFKDGSALGFSTADYNRLKEVYNRAKERSQ